MNGHEFNLTMPRIAMSLPHRLRAPFLYRAGLYDGFWYTVSELAYYLKLDENECRECIGLAADEICKRLGAALEDYVHVLPMADETLLSELRMIAANTNTLSNPNDVARELREAVQPVGAIFAVLGRSGISEDLVAAMHSGAGSQSPHWLIRISPDNVDFITHIGATVFRQREPIGDHRGGSHLGIFGQLSAVNADDNEVTYVDVDLSNEQTAAMWLSTYGINQTCPPDEPFLFEPLKRS